MRLVLRIVVLALLLGGVACTTWDGPTSPAGVIIPPLSTGQPAANEPTGPPPDYVPLGPDGKPVGGWKPAPK